jgi:hypothetical protein
MEITEGPGKNFNEVVVCFIIALAFMGEFLPLRWSMTFASAIVYTDGFHKAGIFLILFALVCDVVNKFTTRLLLKKETK